METILLRDLIIILLISMAVILACFRLRIPPIVGFLLTGVLLGPGGLRLVKGVDQVATLSEIGLVLLLFTVGLEFSLKKILEFKRAFFVGGVIQVGLCLAAGFIAGEIIERPYKDAFFLGVLLAMSSTAIVVKILQEKREMATPHGKAACGILIFQDIITIPFLLAIPFLSGHQAISTEEVATAILGILFLLFVFFASVKIVPRVLDSVTRTRSRELFILAVLGICFGVAWVSSQVGLSLSIGAFLAGLVIAESEYSIEAIGDIVPFKDVFTSLFFVSIGMLADPQFIFDHPLLIITLAGIVIAVKAFAAIAAGLSIGLSLRYSLILGLLLAHIGEFSFVLAKGGIQEGLVTPFLFQLFLDVSIVTMALVPPLNLCVEPLCRLAYMIPLPKRVKSGWGQYAIETHPKKKDHVIIVGFGVPGRNLARSLQEAAIPYVVIEMNPDTVKVQKGLGEPIFYGDATHETTLFHAGIIHAKAIAVVVNDAASAFRIVEEARKINNSIYIIVRCHRVQEMKLFVDVGASDVIPDEFGTSIEIFTRVLKVLQVESESIERLINEMRLEGYELLRQEFLEPYALSEARDVLGHYRLKSITLLPSSDLIGTTLEESGLRKECGVSVLLIKRKGATHSNLLGTTSLAAEDVLVLMGSKENLIRAEKYMKSHEKNQPNPS